MAISSDDGRQAADVSWGLSLVVLGLGCRRCQKEEMELNA